MRDIIRRTFRIPDDGEQLDEYPPSCLPDHGGLAYEVWAPNSTIDGKVPDSLRSKWIQGIAEGSTVPEGYEAAYKRWLDSFGMTRSWTRTGQLKSRMLVGHGQASGLDVGLTLHHTWGVPVIPGSALKGLLANYIQLNYGPADTRFHPSDEDHPERDRAPWQGVGWEGSNIKRGPGELYRALFGAPEADEDGDDDGATQGAVIFHDALVVPGKQGDKLLTSDVLTVHQRAYYNAGHDDKKEVPWASDHDSPNPVSYLAVNSGLRFLFALSGPADWTALAGELLMEALSEWGVGGKTSIGYGRFDDWRGSGAEKAAAAASTLVQDVKAWLEAQKADTSVSNKQLMEGFNITWTAAIEAEQDSAIREGLWQALKAVIAENGKTKEWLVGWRKALTGK
jgi:CRISPR-associated protein Cmr6